MSAANPPPAPNSDSNDAPHGSTAPYDPKGGLGQPVIEGPDIRVKVPADPILDPVCARFAMTDLGNAERMVARHGRDLRFCPELGWFSWDGRRWQLLPEENGKMPAAVMQKIFMAVRAMKHEAAHVKQSGLRPAMPHIMDVEQKQAWLAENGSKMDWVMSNKNGVITLYSDKLAEWARTSEGGAKMRAMADIAKSFNSINVAVEDFDHDRMAINCQNGTLRLEQVRRKRPAADIAAGKSEWHTIWALKLHEHDRDDLITKITRVKYRPNTKAAAYEAFINRVQPQDEMRRFIAQWGGLSLTGYTGEQKLAFFYGSGRNGKGTWVESVAHIAGDYADTLAIESLLDNGKKRGDQATPDIARLPGVRLLRVSEPSKGSVLNEGLVKMVTGEDPVSARHLNKGIFVFDPAFKITISGNNKPIIKDTTDGIWRRMQLVPWEVQVPREEVDTALKSRLIAESEGIFAWLMRGLLDWRKNGLIEPDAVKMATRAYRDDSDDMGRFLRQCCVLGDDLPGRPFRVRKADLFALYTIWAQKTGAYEYTARNFSKEMKSKGFAVKHSNGEYWLGVQRGVEQADLEGGTWSALDEQRDGGGGGDGSGDGNDGSGGGDSGEYDDYIPEF